MQQEKIADGKLIREAVEGFYAKGFQDGETSEMKLIV